MEQEGDNAFQVQFARRLVIRIHNVYHVMILIKTDLALSHDPVPAGTVTPMETNASNVQVTETLAKAHVVLFVTTLMSLEMMGYVTTIVRQPSTLLRVVNDRIALEHALHVWGVDMISVQRVLQV